MTILLGLKLLKSIAGINWDMQFFVDSNFSLFHTSLNKK